MKNVEQYGRDTARERYGKLETVDAPDPSAQKCQCPEDAHGKAYSNDTPSNWLRGMGKNHAEGKPSFDKGSRK